MNVVRYVKSFNKGQFTLPKQIRDYLGIGEEFWLRLYVEKGKIIAEPVDKDSNSTIFLAKEKKKEWAEKLLKMKGNWFSENEIMENRKQLEEQLRKRSLG